MELPGGEVLMHAGRPYDPKKAHEYYLRTRQLKGRKKGQYNPHLATLAKRLAGMSDEQIQQEIEKSKSPAEKKIIKIMLTNRQKKSGPAKPKATPEQKAAAAQRVTSLKSKLADLNQKLKVAMAKARKSEAEKKRGPTQADKNKKAKESKQYRQKHKQKLANKRKTAASKDKASGRSRADSVESIKSDIAETKGRLQKAIARQKALG
jgi:hypothetical protein